METNVPGLYAAGNCAETYCTIRRRPVLHYIGTVAAKQGRVAGENLAARRTSFLGAIGTTVLKVFDLAVARTGLSSAEAAAEGMPAFPRGSKRRIGRPTIRQPVRSGSN